MRMGGRWDLFRIMSVVDCGISIVEASGSTTSLLVSIQH
jgi:hypothetical protein